MKKIFYSSLILISLFSASCSLEDHVLPGEPDVYVAGLENTDSTFVAKYWKNGQEVELTQSYYPLAVNSIAVSGNDVYVVGFGVDSSNTLVTGRYWKNGVLEDFSKDISSSFLSDVEVSGGDIYVAGIGVDGPNAYPAYWKNGVSVKLGENGWAKSIAISGGDVYVAGQTQTGSHAVATYWKNGVQVDLTDGTHDATANAIAVLNGEVLVVGSETLNGVVYSRYWKNGIEIGITGNKNTSEASDITTSNNSIYIAGTDDFHAFIWKNNINNLDFGANASGVRVLDGDVYVSGGGYNNGFAIAQYWKNGSRVILSNGKSHTYATSIFVKKP
ncbi:hypothetical protein [Dyadobacter luticola]|uniref:Chromosome condensation regulator n=1 Tax=Dyadobacter luticola TaxID=1979387 RepID=A0A5R9L551_9BACT|nr:hypothetical protein [Dyadobacter luticola]TLV03395.1 hypothetical protein FEN17_07250 [Dyadobacter luticola]